MALYSSHEIKQKLQKQTLKNIYINLPVRFIIHMNKQWISFSIPSLCRDERKKNKQKITIFALHYYLDSADGLQLRAPSQRRVSIHM